MARVNKFYQTEGRSVVYARFNSMLSGILDNWINTAEVKRKGDFIFITDRAFNYVPEILDAGAIAYEIIEVTKEQEQEVKMVLEALRKETAVSLKACGDFDWDEDKGETVDVKTGLIFELDKDVSVEVNISVQGIVETDEGDYDTPPSSETTWGDIYMDDLKIWIDEGEASFNNEQEQAVLDVIKELIDLN